MSSEKPMSNVSINTECTFDPKNPDKIDDRVNEVLGWFNQQLLLVLANLEAQKKTKEMKKIKDEISKAIRQKGS